MTIRCITAQRFLMVAVLWPCIPKVAAGGERELWDVWQKHITSPDDHRGVVDACGTYAAALPQDPFLPVIHGIEAWHLLCSERAAEAVGILAPYLDHADTALEKGGQRLARAWVTRLQRKRVADALQAYYRSEVRYPQDLEILPHADNMPRTDAWGKPWRYRLVGFQGVPGFRDQKYKLESVSIPPPFDAPAALAIAYAERISARPVRAPQASQDAPLVKLEFVGVDRHPDMVVSQVGESVNGLFIAYTGPNLVILCDTLHWSVLTWKP